MLGGIGPSADPDFFGEALKRLVEELDQAMDEHWRIADRFTACAIDREFRELAATSGMVLKADYKYRKDSGRLKAPSPGGMNAVLRLAFRSASLQEKLIAANTTQILAARKRRLEAHLANGGKLGAGREAVP